MIGRTPDSHSDWVDLSTYNTMAVPARAKSLVTVSSLSELKNAIQDAQQASVPFLVLGEGSNTVFVGDYSGTVIIMALSGVDIVHEQGDIICLRVGAGENWHQLVNDCTEKGWYGLENLALIPGLVGAAPIQNIGAYGVEVKDRIVSVEVYDVASCTLQTIENGDCAFAYRDSRFKRDWAGQKIVTAVTFELTKFSQNVVVNYPALKQRIESKAQGISATKAAPKDVFAAVVSIRSEKLPSPKSIPNTGSFFKNPMVSKAKHQALKALHPNLVAFEQPSGVKLAAAWLIEAAGWKEKEIDGVKVHHEQALVVINPQRRDGFAIEQFARAIQADIREKFGLSLEVEPQLISGLISE